MKYDYNYNKKDNRKKIIIAIIMIVISILVATIGFRFTNNSVLIGISDVILTPFVSIANFTTGLVSNASDFFTNKDTLLSENERLTSENEELKLQQVLSNELIAENESLKRMLDIDKKYSHYELKHGKVIFRNHDNYSNTLTIDIGTNDGIEIYQPVIHSDGLVGYVSNVTENTSIITTILDPQIAVSVTISTINKSAILKSEFNFIESESLKLSHIPINTEISIGDVIYTSGTSSMYPSSIVVGKVTSVVNEKNESDRYAIVEPSVDTGSLSEVSVIIN